MKEFAIYTVARIGLLVASFAVVAGVWALATGGERVPVLWPFLIAAVMSSVASVYLLKGPRQRFAARVEERAARMASRHEEARSREDAS